MRYLSNHPTDFDEILWRYTLVVPTQSNKTANIYGKNFPVYNQV